MRCLKRLQTAGRRSLIEGAIPNAPIAHIPLSFYRLQHEMRGECAEVPLVRRAV
jgi:hypothetical protein